MYQDPYHISYCTNIHPGQDWAVTFANLKKYVPGIKQRLSPDKPFGLGLRLSNQASVELGEGVVLTEFKHWLDANGLYVFTMNGFPYGNFHHERVKEAVHAPDWTTSERLDYTQRLFRQLAVLLPEGESGGISTSPIGYKYNYRDFRALQEAMDAATGHLVQVAMALYQTTLDGGPSMHLDIEPEPDGILENSGELIAFFQDYLLPVGIPKIAAHFGISEVEARGVLLRHITLCYDVCHFSLAYEEPEQVIQNLEKVGIQVGKVQVSAALKLFFDGEHDAEIWEALAAFDEPTYLHQVTEKSTEGVVVYPDLPQVLSQKKKHKELRAHFHVPIFMDGFGRLHSTQDDILKTLAYFKGKGLTEHLEVETYTWEVLPDALQIDLADSIVREMEWLIRELKQ